MRSQLLTLRFILTRPLAYPTGHFYSPVVDPKELNGRYRDPATSEVPAGVAGIELNREGQVVLWESWSSFLPHARRLRDHDTRRRFNPSSSYNIGDAIVYSCMLRHLKPALVIEVGSGSSSALALDVRDQFLARQPSLMFIEPYPEFLESLLRPEDYRSAVIVRSGVQDVPLSTFDELQANDILFIDSTHVVKTGSDVVFELFDILPRLRSGVVVHFHDVLYPFEYPRDWVIERNFSWNEIYTLRAFLIGNRDWEILFFNDYFAKVERDRVERDAPEVLNNPGGGLWLRKR